jgi:hypothetical protein
MSESAKSEIFTVEWPAPGGHSAFFVLAKSQQNAKTILKNKETGDFTWTPIDGAIGVAVPCTSTAPASTAGTAPSGPSSSTKGGGTKLNGLPVVLQTIGVLGKNPGDKGKNDIPQNHIVVDPAGLPYVHGTLSIKTDANGEGGAGGLSGLIYAHYHILNEGNRKGVALNQCERFPELVTDNITKVGGAFAHRYYEGTVIHVVGPDFSTYKGITLDDAVPTLSEAYYNVIRVAEQHVHTSNTSNEHNDYKKGAVVRLSLVSMGKFAGPFQGNTEKKAELTARAVIDAFAKCKSEDSPTKPAPEVHIEYWMCLYQSDTNQPHYKEYESAFQKYIEIMKSSPLMV